MISGILSHTELTHYPIIAVVFFFLFFVGMLAWVFRPGSRAVYDARSRMILDDNTKNSEGRNGQP